MFAPVAIGRGGDIDGGFAGGGGNDGDAGV
jgi:hypothetical protein